MTRAELISTAIAWADGRTDLEARMDVFLQLVESEIMSGGVGREPLRSREMEAVAVLTLTDGKAALPVDLEAIQRVSNACGVMRYVPPAFEPDHYLSTNVYTGPTYPADMARHTFTIEGSDIIASEPEVTLHYLARPAALVADDDTHAVLERDPGIYLHGLLRQCYLYLVDTDAATMHAAEFATAITAANGRAARARMPEEGAGIPLGPL